jgi:hypothetical protein
MKSLLQKMVSSKTAILEPTQNEERKKSSPEMILEKKVSVNMLQELIEHSWRQAIKYKFDPVAGRIHSEYLELTKKMQQELLND